MSQDETESPRTPPAPVRVDDPASERVLETLRGARVQLAALMEDLQRP